MSIEETYKRVQYWTLLFLVGLSLIIGTMIQSFIVAVHAMDWLNGRPISPTDQITTSLVISRFVFQFVGVVNLFFLYFFPSSFHPSVKKCFEFIELTAIHCSIWLLTLLSVTFCLKVSNYHNVFFVRLRVLILQRTVSQIILSVLISLALASVFIWFPYDAKSENSTHSLMLNISQIDLDFKRYADIFAYGNIYPFIINFFSSVILMTSLYHHLMRMKSSRNLTTDLGPYYFAIKATMCCLVGYGLQILSFLVVLNYYMYLGPIWSYVICNYFPVLHSGYIIYKMNKLKRKFSRILEMGICCVCHRIGRQDPE